MDVKLVSITPDIEKTIAYCARVSNPSNQNSTSLDLLKYCIKHQHWSVFEMGNMCLEITTSRAIARQILRHRSFNFSEFSLRYAEASGFETYEARRQDVKNRQNSTDDLTDLDKVWFQNAQKDIALISMSYYKEALQLGIAKESARFLLPETVSTRLYMNGTVRSWIHYLKLRTGNGTQLEHMEVAKACEAIFATEMPNIYEAWHE